MLSLLALVIALATAQPAWGAGEWRHEGKELAVEYAFRSLTEAVNPQIRVSAVKLVIECKTSRISGVIAAQDKIKSTAISFGGCKSEVEGKAQCEVNTPDLGKEELVTTVLSGRVEVAAAAEAASERGIKLEPVAGKPFVEIESVCLPTGYGGVKVKEQIQNIVLAEIEPKAIESKVFTIKWLLSAGQQKLRNFPRVPEGPFSLKLVGNEATLENSDKVEFEGACFAKVKIEVN